MEGLIHEIGLIDIINIIIYQALQINTVDFINKRNWISWELPKHALLNEKCGTDLCRSPKSKQTFCLVRSKKTRTLCWSHCQTTSYSAVWTLARAQWKSIINADDEAFIISVSIRLNCRGPVKAFSIHFWLLCQIALPMNDCLSFKPTYTRYQTQLAEIRIVNTTRK